MERHPISSLTIRTDTKEQNVLVRRARTMAESIPMRTHPLELKPNARPGMCSRGDRESCISGKELMLGDAFGHGDLAKSTDRLTAGVAHDILRPRNLRAAVGTEEMVLVRGKMPETELVIVGSEVTGGKLLLVGLTLAADVAGAPTGIDEFPLAVVNFHGAPSMVSALGWDQTTRWNRIKAVSLTVTANHDTPHSGFAGDGGEETGIAFADCQTAGEGRCRGRRLNAIVEEGVDIVRYIMMKPCEDDTGLVCCGWEWSC